MTADYDEEAFKVQLDRFSREGKTACAAAWAERLAPFFELYAAASPETDAGTELRQVIDVAWALASGGVVVGPEHFQVLAENLVPSDDGEWIPEAGYAQNAAAAAAYAIRTWLLDSSQEAVWAARQVYELADYDSQTSAEPLANVDQRAGDGEPSDFVRDAVTTIHATLDEIEHGKSPMARLRTIAQNDGQRWIAEAARRRET